MAQAALELNREDGGNRRFIMVQLPEPTDNPDFPTIADIGKERIRRVIAQMRDGDEDAQLSLDLRPDEDLGFRVYKLAPSTLAQWRPPDADTPTAYTEKMSLGLDTLKPDADPAAVIAEVALKTMGYPLTYTVTALTPDPSPGGRGTESEGLYRVADPETGRSFTISLAARLTLEDCAPLNLTRTDTFICRASALDDETAANLALQCDLKVI